MLVMSQPVSHLFEARARLSLATQWDVFPRLRHRGEHPLHLPYLLAD